MVTQKSTLEGPCLFSDKMVQMSFQESEKFEILWGDKSFTLGDGKLNAENSSSRWLLGESQLILVEHLLSSSLFFKPFKVVIEHNEIPLFDGSSKIYFDLLNNMGLSKKVEEFDCSLNGSWHWSNGYFKVEPASHFSIDAKIKTDEFEMRNSWSSIESPKKILYSRTFINENFLAQRLSNDVFKGAKEGMGIIIDVKGRPKNEDFRNSTELVNHKILDLLGDVAWFNGKLPKLKIECENTNHAENHKLIERIMSNVIN
jgi:UDP-3-O-acyl-N-acetylglucosamine deacetylase